ncbi:MAG: hypothetical protein HC867_01610 [Bacteroidia bacterium]|nr:hypothetical protein [Bacteroidia bacterium]
MELDIEIAQKDKELISSSVDTLDKEKEQLITQRAALNIDSQISLLNKDIDTETDKRNRKSAESSRYTGYCEQLKLDTEIDESVFRSNYNKVQDLNISVPGEIEKLSEKKVRLKY